MAKEENIIDAAPAVSGNLRPEAGSAYEVPRIAVKEYCLVSNAVCTELRNLYEVETGFALFGIRSMVLTKPPEALTVRGIWLSTLKKSSV